MSNRSRLSGVGLPLRIQCQGPEPQNSWSQDRVYWAKLLSRSHREPLPGVGTKYRQRVICNLGRVDLLAPSAAASPTAASKRLPRPCEPPSRNPAKHVAADRFPSMGTHDPLGPAPSTRTATALP